MNRFFIDKLMKWSNDVDRKPLVLSGARQVGKTWVLQEFGRQRYAKVAYVNFDQNEPLKRLFDGGFDLKRILIGLNAESGVDITPGDTLVIFDEIQECGAALTSLKYWQERANDYHIASAGSLLGLSLQEGTGFPVGKTDSLTLHPMSFGEYLDAVGEGKLYEVVRSGDGTLLNAFAEKLTAHLKSYYLVGGMPAALAAFVRANSIEAARKVQLAILSDYNRDFAKHAPKVQLPRIRAVWRSLPLQLARADKRFISGEVRVGEDARARSRDLKDPIEWLEGAGLVSRIWNVTKPALPLEAYRNHLFKLFGVDVGLLAAQSRLSIRTVLDGSRAFTEFKGALTEQFVQQELCAADIQPYYWTSGNSRVEVDFVIEGDSGVIPIEAKAEKNLRSKSLSSFRERFGSVLSVRTSLAGFERQDGLLNLPLFAIGELKGWLSE